MTLHCQIKHTEEICNDRVWRRPGGAITAGGGGEMARDTQTGVFDSCLAALPLQKPKTEQILTECASVDGHRHHALSKLKSV